MPRVKGLTTDQKIDRQHKLVSDKCKKIMRANGITQERLARATGITQSAISQQFKEGITVPLLIAIVSMTDATPEELKKMMQIGGFK